MTTAIRFNLRAAEEAVARDEEGVDLLPGDTELIDIYEKFCQQEHAALEERIYADERARWLATQCPVCVDGGTGPECDECFIAEDARAVRREDI